MSRSAFEGAQTNPSAAKQQVSKTLSDMRLSVEDEVRCPKSGYSIDMLVHDKTLGVGDGRREEQQRAHVGRGV